MERGLQSIIVHNIEAGGGYVGGWSLVLHIPRQEHQSSSLQALAASEQSQMYQLQYMSAMALQHSGDRALAMKIDLSIIGF